MGTYARNAGGVRPRRGHAALGRRRATSTSTSSAGISVAQLGHCHPRVVEAVREQAGRLMHVGNLFYTEPGDAAGQAAGRAARSAARCSSATPAPRPIECAIKLARRRKPGGDFVVLEGGFHGRTDGGAVGHPAGDQAGAVRAARARLRGGAARRRPLRAVDDGTAAVLIEPIQGESGIHPIDPELLAAARERVRRATARS